MHQKGDLPQGPALRKEHQRDRKQAIQQVQLTVKEILTTTTVQLIAAMGAYYNDLVDEDGVELEAANQYLTETLHLSEMHEAP